MPNKTCEYISILLFFLFLYPPVYGMGKVNSKSSGSLIRHPTAAGSFYPGNPGNLKAEVSSMLGNASGEKTSGEIIAAIAPHAGYVYSGNIAALTFKSISDIDFDTIVIIGHDSYQDAIAYTCPVDYFETPLGKVPVDKEMVKRLHEYNKGIIPNRFIYNDDQTIEIQLPFLQVLKKRCMIVPILFGNPTVRNCEILAKAIKASSGNKKIFLLASSDMSHYPDYRSAYNIDNMTLDSIKPMNIKVFFDHVTKQRLNPGVPNLITPLCASGGVGTAIIYSRIMGANHVEVLKYANSGDVPGGDKGRVVGYSSVLFVKD